MSNMITENNTYKRNLSVRQSLKHWLVLQCKKNPVQKRVAHWPAERNRFYLSINKKIFYLTRRELQFVCALIKSSIKTRYAIASDMHVTPHTIDLYTLSVKEKFNVETKSDLVLILEDKAVLEAINQLVQKMNVQESLL